MKGRPQIFVETERLIPETRFIDADVYLFAKCLTIPEGNKNRLAALNDCICVREVGTGRRMPTYLEWRHDPTNGAASVYDSIKIFALIWDKRNCLDRYVEVARVSHFDLNQLMSVEALRIAKGNVDFKPYAVLIEVDARKYRRKHGGRCAEILYTIWDEIKHGFYL